MVKDAKKYASTGGWGFGKFVDGKPADEAEHKACFACHEANVKGHDYVSRALRPDCHAVRPSLCADSMALNLSGADQGSAINCNRRCSNHLGGRMRHVAAQDDSPMPACSDLHFFPIAGKFPAVSSRENAALDAEVGE